MVPIPRFVWLASCAVIALCSGCSSSAAAPAPKKVYVLNGENEDLNVYDVLAGFKKRVAFSGNEREQTATLPALNGQICFDPSGSRQLVMGDDGGQADPRFPPGWAILQLSGSSITDFSAARVNKLVPTYQDPKVADNYGCAYLKDGRILTTDIGNAETGAGNGQLTVFFPPFAAQGDVNSPTLHFCKIDVTIGTAGGIWVDAEERVYVASARGDAGIYRYTGPFPTGDDAAHGCGKKDPVGSPMADGVAREKFIAADNALPTPYSIVGSPRGTFFVASVLNGVIAEYDAQGKPLRRVLEPGAGALLPYKTGNPQGLGIDAEGTLYYADIGLVLKSGGVDSGENAGTVRRIRFIDGEPQPPETIDAALNFPDGIGVFEP